MGGGTTMRAAAAKFSTHGGAAVHGGFRGAAAPPPPAEQAVRKSSIPVSAMLSSSSSGRAGADVAAAVHSPAWEDDLVVAAGEPMPRVVFAGVPSFDEAKEATDELKDALDKVYLSPPGSSTEPTGLSLVSNPDTENNSLLVVGTNGTRSIPNHALQAFRLLATSTKAQNVVASIASDQNVWEAVMHNPVLQEFIQSNKTSFEFQEPVFPEGSSVEPEARDSGNWFSKTVENTIKTFETIKLTAVDLVRFLSSKLNNIFGNTSDVNGNGKTGFPDMTVGLGASFIGLATMVVMVVLLRRV